MPQLRFIKYLIDRHSAAYVANVQMDFRRLLAHPNASFFFISLFLRADAHACGKKRKGKDSFHPSIRSFVLALGLSFVDLAEKKSSGAAVRHRTRIAGMLFR